MSKTMKHKFGQVGDDRLILMASLMVTDELWELRRQIAGDEDRDWPKQGATGPSPTRSTKSPQADLAARVSAVADRLEMLNERFAGRGGRRRAAPQRDPER